MARSTAALWTTAAYKRRSCFDEEITCIAHYYSGMTTEHRLTLQWCLLEQFHLQRSEPEREVSLLVTMSPHRPGPSSLQASSRIAQIFYPHQINSLSEVLSCILNKNLSNVLTILDTQLSTLLLIMIFQRFSLDTILCNKNCHLKHFLEDRHIERDQYTHENMAETQSITLICLTLLPSPSFN